MLTATCKGMAGLGVNDGARLRSRVNWPMLSSWFPLILIQSLLCSACATAEGTAAYTQQHIEWSLEKKEGASWVILSHIWFGL